MQTKKLIYFYDALCGWCYGFSPVMVNLHATFRDQLEFEVVSGGMILDDREGAIGEVAPYIKSAYREVEEATGITFGEAFLKGVLEPGEAFFSSWLPALGLSAFELELPQQTVAFSAALQKAIYFAGALPAALETYQGLAVDFGLDPGKLLESMRSQKVEQEARKHFYKTQQFGIAGFPALVLEAEHELFLVSRGFHQYEDIAFRLEQILRTQ